MKKAKKHTEYYCPDCNGHVNKKGITYCLCEDGYWEDARWKKEKEKGERGEINYEAAEV